MPPPPLPLLFLILTAIVVFTEAEQPLCSPENLKPHPCPPFSSSSPPPFPFSVSPGCGHPSFQLHCSSPHSLISINNLSFSLLEYQPSSSSLLLTPTPTTTHCSAAGTSIPSQAIDLTGTPFRVSDAWCSRLSVLKPCPKSVLPNCSVCSFHCSLIKNPLHLFVNGCGSITRPVSDQSCESDVIDFLQRSLALGIEIDWEQDQDPYFGHCSDCRSRNGICGFNSSDPDKTFVCVMGRIELSPPWIHHKVFERMPKRGINSWNSIILGLAMHGEAKMALDYFHQMVQKEGLVPNSVTFVGLLSACNHRGMVQKGRNYFKMMVEDYNIEPQLEHYGCLVDLLARAGFIEEALNILSEMPMKPDLVIWRSILDACCNKNGGIELSEEVAKQILDSEGSNSSGVYVLLSKVYASAARWDEVGLMRKLMTDRGVAKEPGCSSIEMEGVNHEFFAGDTSHPETKLIYEALEAIEERLKVEERYKPDTSEAAMVDEEEWLKQRALGLHSERLAIAYGLIHGKPGSPIRVFKNLRVCKDCHEVSKLISKVFDVEIVVRDRARFHHFRGGSCTCLDYW